MKGLRSRALKAKGSVDAANRQVPTLRREAVGGAARHENDDAVRRSARRPSAMALSPARNSAMSIGLFEVERAVPGQGRGVSLT